MVIANFLLYLSTFLPETLQNYLGVNEPYTPPAEGIHLSIKDLYCVTKIRDDTWNKYKNGQVDKWWYIDADEAIKAHEEDDERGVFRVSNPIAYISYRPFVGQIGIIDIADERYKGIGIGKEMLRIAIEDTKKANKTTEIWAVTSDNHPFWSNVWGRAFKPRKPAHVSVYGSGYYYDFARNSAHETCGLQEKPDTPTP